MTNCARYPSLTAKSIYISGGATGIGAGMVEELIRQGALRAHIKPIQIANMVLFLAADDSEMITGQQFVIDAGRT